MSEPVAMEGMDDSNHPGTDDNSKFNEIVHSEASDFPLDTPPVTEETLPGHADGGECKQIDSIGEQQPIVNEQSVTEQLHTEHEGTTGKRLEQGEQQEIEDCSSDGDSATESAAEVSTAEADMDTKIPDASTTESDASTKRNDLSTTEADTDTKRPDASTTESDASTKRNDLSTTEADTETKTLDDSSTEADTEIKTTDTSVKEAADISTPEPGTDTKTSDDSTEEKDDKWVLVLGHQKLKKKTLRKGEGYSSRPQHGQIVSMSYSIRLTDGAELEQDKHVTFTLGDGDVIQALDLCCALMELHEVSEIVTEAQYAYGTRGRSNGSDPDIPPDSQLTITAELLVTEEVPDYSMWQITYRVKEANKKRERGNDLYSRGEHSSAINSYTKALTILDDSEETTHDAYPEDLQLLLDARNMCYNNLAAAQMKVEAWDAAIKSCDEVLKKQPENVKALFRKGKCLGHKADLETAVTILQKALRLEPQTKIIHQELSKLKALNKKQEDSQRDMYQRMFWGSSNKAAAKKRREQNSRWWLYMGSAAAAAIVSISIAAYRYMHV